MGLWDGYPGENAWDTAQSVTPAFQPVEPPEPPKSPPWVPAPPAQKLPDSTAEPYAASPKPVSFMDYARKPQQTFESRPGGPKLARITSPSGAPFSVNAEYGDRFSAFLKDLEDAGYPVNPKASGGYNYRNIAGTNKLSKHAHGNAIDINWDENPRGGMGKIPADVARSLAQKHGLTWGGDWRNPDPMHFEIAVPGQPGHTYGDGHNHGAPPSPGSAPSSAPPSSGPVASASPSRSKPMPDNSGGGFFSFLSKPMDLFGNAQNADILKRAGPQGYQPVDGNEFIKRHPALKGVEGVDQLVAISNLQRDLMSGALQQPRATWGQGIGEALKGVGAVLTSRVDPKLGMSLAGTVGQSHREQQELVKKMQMQALLQQTQALGGDLGDVVKTQIAESRKRKADQEKMQYGEFGIVPPSLSGSPVSPGTAPTGAVAQGITPPGSSATAAPVVPGTTLGTPPPGLMPTPPAGVVPAAPGAGSPSAPGSVPTPNAAPTGGQQRAGTGVPDPIQDNLEKARRYLIMGDVARAKEYHDRAKIAQEQRKYDSEIPREIEKQRALGKLKSEQADEDKSRSRDQTRSNLNFSLDALESLVNSENIEGAIGPLEGNEYVQRLKAAIPFTSGKDFELNQRIKQQTGAIRAQLGSGLFKGEGPLSEGERAMASQIMGDLEFASTSDSFKKLINDARPLFDKIMRWESEGRPPVSAWTDPNDPRKRPQTSTGQDKPTAASAGQAKPAPVSTAPPAYLEGLPENKPIKLSSGRTVVRKGTQLFELSPEEAAKLAPMGSEAPIDPAAMPVSP